MAWRCICLTISPLQCTGGDFFAIRLIFDSRQLVPRSFVVPILVDRKSCHEIIKPWELLQRNGKKNSSIKYCCIAYDLGFSLTYDKTQSKSFRRLILDLQLWPKMSLTAEKVLVGLSRVETLEHLRILPYNPSGNQNHLYTLKPNELMLHWFAGYDETDRMSRGVGQFMVLCNQFKNIL